PRTAHAEPPPLRNFFHASGLLWRADTGFQRRSNDKCTDCDKERDDKLVESVAGSFPGLGQGSRAHPRRCSWARSRSSQPHAPLCWYRRWERTPLRGAPNTAAEEVAEPIAGSFPSPYAWPRFPEPAVYAHEFNSS